MISSATTKEGSYRLDFLKIIYFSNNANLFSVHMVYNRKLYSSVYVYSILHQKFNQLFEQIKQQRDHIDAAVYFTRCLFPFIYSYISMFDIRKFCGF